MTKAGQVASGRPPMLSGYSIADAQYCRVKPVIMPQKAMNSTSLGSTVRFLWMMSFSSSIGMGV